MPSIADVFLRVIPVTDKREIEKELDKVDTKPAGKTAGAVFTREFTKSAAPRKAGEDAGKQFGMSFGDIAGKTLSAIGPGILGAGLKTSGIVMGGTLAGAMLPALTAGLAAGVTAGGGLLTILLGGKALVGSKEAQGPLYAQAQQIAKTFTDAMRQAASGMLTPLQQAFNRIPGMLQQLTPALRSLFAGAGTLIAPLLNGVQSLAMTVLPQLGQAFRAVAPLLQPMISGITSLIAGLMPGLITLLRAAAPAVQALSGFLGMLGKGLGDMFTAFAPALRASSSIINSLGQVLGALLPVLAQLAGIFASALAPAFAQFARVFQALTPVLVLAGQLLAEIAKAMLEDLNWALKGVADLFVALQPALTGFVKALTGVFTVLENAGVFQVFGAALVQIAPLLGQLATTLLNGLTPILPLVIKFVGDLAVLFANFLARAIAAILPPLTQLAGAVLKAIATILPVILPLLLAFVSMFTGALATVIEAIAQALTAIINAIPPKILNDIVIAILAIVTAMKAWAVIQGVLDALMAANPIGIVVLALAALVTGLVAAWQHSAAFRSAVEAAWSAVKTATEVLWNTLRTFLGWMVTAWGAVEAAWNTVVAWFRGAAAAITGVFQGIITWVTTNFDRWWAANGDALKQVWAALWGAIQAVVGPVWALIKAVVQAGWDAVSIVFRVTAAIVKGIWDVLWAVVTAAARTAWTVLGAVIKAGWETVRVVFATVSAIVLAAWRLLWTTIEAVLRAAWTVLQTVLRTAWDIVVGIFTFFINLVTGRWGAAWNAIKTMFQQVWNGIVTIGRTMTGLLAALLSAAWTAISSTAHTLWNGLSSWFSTWWGALKSAWSGTIDGIKSLLSGAWDAIKTTAKGAWDGIKSAIKTIWDGITEVIKAPLRLAGGAWNLFADAINNTVGKIFNVHVPRVNLGFAQGGKIPGYGGGDIVPFGIAGGGMAMLEPGETVVSKESSRLPYMQAAFREARVPGYQGGGVVGYQGGGIIDWGKGIVHDAVVALIPGGQATVDLAKKVAAITLNTAGIPKGFWGDLAKQVLAQMAGEVKKSVEGKASSILASMSGGEAIAAYAQSFLGRIPYVWGGASPLGADCSGFVQFVYSKYGIDAPRTSEAQGAWVRRAQPSAGGLAFYHSPAGGPDPGHVAIIKDAATVISQGGGMGPKLMGLRGMPLLWTGVPPGGFGAGAITGLGGPAIGTSAAAAQAYARTRMGDYKWSGADMASLILLWNGECLTLSAVILTRRGWLRHDQVQPGDETIGYNPATGRSEWTRITRVVHYDDAPVMRIGHSRWHADVTPDHRWWNDHRMNNGRGRVRQHSGFTRTRDLGRGDRLRLAAPADTAGIPGLSLEDVTVLAWLQGDGYIQPVTKSVLTCCPECGWVPSRDARNPARSIALHRTHPRVSHGITSPDVRQVTGYTGRIYQSKPAQITRLRAILARIDHTESVVPSRRPGCAEEHVFLLRQEYVSDLIKRSGLMDTGPEQFALRLSPEQRAAWLAAMIDAEGHIKGRHTVIRQNSGPLHDAIVLAVYLEGFRPTVHPDADHPLASAIGLTQPHASVDRFGPPQVLPRQPVWCVTTELGTWTAQQDGHVFLTGNSGWRWNATNPTSGAYGIPQAVPASKMASAGADWRTNAATQVNWGLNYIKSVYGSPSAAYYQWLQRSPHWYRPGGLVKAFANGGRIPEPVLGVGASGTSYTFGRGEEVQSAAAARATADRLAQVVDRLDRLIATTAAVPAGVGRHVGGAIGGAASDAAFRSRYPRSGW